MLRYSLLEQESNIMSKVILYIMGKNGADKSFKTALTNDTYKAPLEDIGFEAFGETGNTTLFSYVISNDKYKQTFQPVQNMFLSLIQDKIDNIDIEKIVHF
jgi:hypothetical protein